MIFVESVKLSGVVCELPAPAEPPALPPIQRPFVSPTNPSTGVNTAFTPAKVVIDTEGVVVNPKPKSVIATDKIPPRLWRIEYSVVPSGDGKNATLTVTTFVVPL